MGKEGRRFLPNLKKLGSPRLNFDENPRQLGGGPGVGGLDGGGTPYDNYTGKQAKNKATKKINGRRLLH